MKKFGKKEALKMREILEKYAASLTETECAEAPALLPAWDPEGHFYTIGDRVQYEGTAYKVLSNHTSQTDWTPADAPSLFAEILIPDPEVIPEWKQPESTNPYMKGDKVKHGGKVWISDVDNNVWEPGVYGWTEVAE